jgi:UPF0755 protein
MDNALRTYISIAASVLLLAAYQFYLVLSSPASDEFRSHVVNVERGASFDSVVKALAERGLLRNAAIFRAAGVISGSAKRVRAGEYEFTTAETPVEILKKLVRGDVMRHSVTFPEGSTMKDMAGILAASGLMDAGSFIEAARDAKLKAALGVDGPTLEGYLFPDTYSIDKAASAKDLVRNMHSNFMKAFGEDARKKAATLGISINEAVTLASIIEKETGRVEEMRLISSVFHNRLRRGMPLQSDPTVIYGIKDFDGNLTRAHLKTMTPYNTYMVRGLPPGPIASPGKAAIEAAVDPDKTDYLYFVSRNDGTHAFSATLSAHNRAVYQYQKSGAR